MMRTALKLASTALAGLALAGSLAAPAQAVSAYPHMNYSGNPLGGTDRSNVGTVPRRGMQLCRSRRGHPGLAPAADSIDWRA